MTSITDQSVVAPLFAGWTDSFVWSCLQGCMGTAWADSTVAPRSAQIVTGDFCCLAGVPDRELAANTPSEYIIMSARDEAWFRLIEEVHGERAVRATRYGIKKEGDIFDRDLLRGYAASLPAGYALRRIDAPLYREILALPWARDLVGNFRDCGEYLRHGIGFVAVKGGEIVSGASSYSRG